MFKPAWAGQVCSLGYTIGPLIEGDLGLTLTSEQAARVIDYWRLDPLTGGRDVRRAALRRPKGAGKSPEGGYCGYAEFVLPVMFSHWDNGQPIGIEHPDPWVQFAAVSEDQTDNVMVWLYDILADRSDTCRRRNIDLGRTRLYLKDRSGRVEPVTAASDSREGQRVSFAVMDQTESWTKENNGRKLADTIRRNVAKMGGWTLELQNAPRIGDGSVADQTAKASDRRAKGVLFDTREPSGPFDLANPELLKTQLAFSYGDAARVNGGWVDTEHRLVEEILDPDTDPADAFAYYLNISPANSDWAFDRERWELLGDGQVPDPGELIVAGFDGARHDDATALVAVSVETGAAWTVGLWERPDGLEDWEVPEHEVTAAVEEMLDRWSVWRVYCDPPYWSDTISGWEARRFKTPDRKQAIVHWWTNRWRPVGMACRELATAIRSGAIHHVVDEPDDLSRHMRNAVKRTVASRDDQGRPLWTLSKPAPGRKIDAAMALVLAWEARNDAIASGVQKKSNRAVFA